MSEATDEILALERRFWEASDDPSYSKRHRRSWCRRPGVGLVGD